MKRIEYLILFLILVIAFVLRLYKINNPIGDWHAWRQVDTASVTKIYLDQGVDVFRPRYYDISSIQTGTFNPEGYRFVEFPVFNVVHAWFYHSLPVSLAVAGRLVSITSALVSMVALYLLGKRLMSQWVGLASAFFYGVMPYNIFFTRVVLPEPMAVAFSLWGLLLFVYYVDSDKLGWLLCSSVFFALAILVKPFALFYGVPAMYLVKEKYGWRGILKNYWLLVALDVVLVPFFLWRAWMNRPPYLFGIPHLAWAFNGDGIRFRPSFWMWIFGERLGGLMLGFWGLVPFGVGLSTKKDRGDRGVLASFLFGMFLYVSIVATANVRHDYYQTFVVPAVALTLGYGGVAMWKGFGGVEKWTTRGLVIFSTGMMLLIGLYKIMPNYAINHPEMVLAGERVDELTPKDALVIAPNNGDTMLLYQTGRFGWPVVDESIEGMIEKGADYYVSVNFNDPDSINFPQKYETVEKTNQYIILDLRKPI